MMAGETIVVLEMLRALFVRPKLVDVRDQNFLPGFDIRERSDSLMRDASVIRWCDRTGNSIWDADVGDGALEEKQAYAPEKT